MTNFRRGQSLIELIVGLGIGTLMIGAAAAALLLVSQSKEGTDRSQVAGALANSLLDKVIVAAESNWNTNTYNLSKGSSNKYFIISTGTSTSIVLGEESILSGNVASSSAVYLKFDEAGGNTAWDFSGNAKHAALVNSPTRSSSANCKIGTCLSFDGSDDYISVPAVGIASGSFTVGAWINPARDEADGYGTITGYDSTHRFLVRASTGLLLVQFGGNFYSTASLDANTWSHAVYEYDSAADKEYFYVNGIYDSEHAPTSAPVWNSAFKIGQYDLINYKFHGLIDDFRVYNRALTASEISQLYNSSAYTRYFYIDNVSRDADQVIETTYNSANDDPSTQKVTIDALWFARGATNTVELISYLTRWGNNSTTQTDWSGGSGATGPITDFGSSFDSSTGVDYSGTSGSIKISGL